MNTSINERIALFCECFGDTREVAEDLFSCQDLINVSICNEDRLVAMASLVPILAPDRNAFGYYIYGVCVVPDMRGRGLFREIMQKAETEAKNRGADYACLVPADFKLANTYKKMGYTIPVYQKTDCVGAKGLKLISEGFRAFAKSEPTEKVRQTGLLKLFNENKFYSHTDKLCFLDDMGDI